MSELLKPWSVAVPPSYMLPRAFTTGQVAKMCRVAPRTVSKWVDSGRLKGFRLPGSQDRRIFTADVVAFLREHGLPVPQALSAGVTVSYAIRPEDAAADWLDAPTPFDLGVVTADNRVEAAVIGDADGVSQAVAAAKLVLTRHPQARVYLLVCDDVALEAGLPGVTVLRRSSDWRPVVEAGA